MKDKWKEIVSIAVSAILALVLFAALLVGLGWNMLLCMGLSLVSYAGTADHCIEQRIHVRTAPLVHGQGKERAKKRRAKNASYAAFHRFLGT